MILKKNMLISVLSLLLVSPLIATQVIANDDCNTVRAKYQCPTQKHQLHLSFDDGVGSVTPKILDILKRENIKATFLVLGNKVDCKKHLPGTLSLKLCKERFATLQRIKREGHDIGSHSYEHHHHSKLAPAELTKTIMDSRRILDPYFTTEPAIFRLPYGDGWFNQKDQPQVMQALKKAKFYHLGWEMTAYDWNEKYQHGDQILDNVLGQMCGKGKRGRDGVVLFHDGVFENEHEGRVFTANNLARWIPKMRCVADFKPLLFLRKSKKEMTVHVAIGIIFNNKNQILITKRSADQHQANKWEFPGGKVEASETAVEALSRELKEELGIQLESAVFLLSLNHQYKSKKVILDVYEVREWLGEPKGLEGQPMRWIERSELNDYDFPTANAEILHTLLISN